MVSGECTLYWTQNNLWSTIDPTLIGTAPDLLVPSSGYEPHCSHEHTNLVPMTLGTRRRHLAYVLSICSATDASCYNNHVFFKKQCRASDIHSNVDRTGYADHTRVYTHRRCMTVKDQLYVLMTYITVDSCPVILLWHDDSSYLMTCHNYDMSYNMSLTSPLLEVWDLTYRNVPLKGHTFGD